MGHRSVAVLPPQRPFRVVLVLLWSGPCWPEGAAKGACGIHARPDKGTKVYGNCPRRTASQAQLIFSEGKGEPIQATLKSPPQRRLAGPWRANARQHAQRP